MDLLKASISEISSAVRSKKISAVAVHDFFKARAESLNPKLNAFLCFNDNSRKEAQAVDDKIAQGKDPGILAGVPIALKDLLCKKDLRTTAASKILANFVPPYNSTVVERLEAAGAVIIGKTNLDEFAMGSSNENSAFGASKNPWNLEYVTGGSSGGTASAVAANLCPAGIGTDTGGSIRQPSSFTGLYGIKPTYGRVSRYGIVAFASSLDQAGPMCRSTEDAALVLTAIAGKDPKDATSSSQSIPNWSEEMKKGVKSLKIGLAKEHFADGLSADVRKVMENCIANLKSQGAEFVDISLPHSEYSIATYYIVATSEASSNLARYDGVRYGFRAEAKNIDDLYSKSRGQAFGSEVKRRIMIGTYVLSSGYYEAYYKKALKVRKLLQEDFLQAFKKCDVILSPVTAEPPFKLGEKISDPMSMYLNDIFTTSTNLAGLPGMSVPAGFSSNQLPIGVQLTANHFAEDKIFRVSQALESALNLKEKVPNVY